MDDKRLNEIWQQLDRWDQEYSASHNPKDFDIEEAKVSALEYFVDNPDSDAAPASVFCRYLKRERVRRVRNLRVGPKRRRG